MRLYEIINTPLSAALSYDVKHNKLKVRKKPGLELDAENRRVVAVPTNPAAVTLRMLNRIKKLKRKYEAEQERLTKFRGLMYGGTVRAREQEIEHSRAALDDLQAQIAAEIRASELEQERQEQLDQLAMRYVKRK